MFITPEFAWKKLPGPRTHATALRRTSRDVAGTAYWRQDGESHFLWVKVREDRWLCFKAASIDACLAAYTRTPGAGGRADDSAIAHGVVGNALHVTQFAAKPKKPPRRLTLRLTPDAMWRGLEERGAQVIRRPVSAKELEKAQTVLDFRFPPSYVDLVMGDGAPAIGTDPKAAAEKLSFTVLTPKEVVRFTRELRDLPSELFDDSESIKAQLDNAIFFQLGRDAGEGHVFLVDTADASGEMRVADYHHDYLEELDWRPRSGAVFRSLSASTLHVVQRLADELP